MDRAETVLSRALRLHREALDALPPEAAVALVGDRIRLAVQSGAKVLFCGNGGSAADAQHLAAEFVGRLRQDRPALPAVALTVDTSVLTAVSNDYGFEQVFARQVEAIGNACDVLVCLSTSGSSPNVLAACEAAKAKGLTTIAMTGAAPNPLAEQADLFLAAPGASSAQVQEMHIFLGHILCEIAETPLPSSPFLGRPGCPAQPLKATPPLHRKALFLDRDGIINVDKGYVFKLDDFEWMPGIHETVAKAKAMGYAVVVVTNQSGVARGLYRDQDVRALSQWMAEHLDLDAVYYCPHLDEHQCPARKPGAEMINVAVQELGLIKEGSFLIGDRQRDIDAAHGAGIDGYLYEGGSILELFDKINPGLKTS